MTDVVFLNGPVAGAHADLPYEPQRVELSGGTVYARVNDPCTGESLHAYALEAARGARP